MRLEQCRPRVDAGSIRLGNSTDNMSNAGVFAAQSLNNRLSAKQ